MKKKFLWLHFAYWLGIVLDAGAALVMLFPAVNRLAGWPVRFPMDEGLIYGMRFGAPCMVGWTVLLYWASRKPVERSAVIPLTLIPILMYSGLLISNMIAGYSKFTQMLPTIALQALLLGIYGYTSIRIHHLDRTPLSQ